MTGIITSIISLILLSLFSAAFSGHAAAVLALGGALMIAVTAGYVRDSGGKRLKALQLLLAVLFSLCTGKWWGCFVFACLLWPGLPASVLMADGTLVFIFLLLLFVPGYDADALLQGRDAGFVAASLIVRLFATAAVCALAQLFRHLLKKKERKEEEKRQRIQSYSLSEMHESRRSRELARQSFYIDRNARLIERENISRNIHNSVGHSITAAIMTLDAADMLFEKKPEEARKKMNDATERIRGSLGAIRSAVRALDDEAEDVSVKDLICWFDNIVDEFQMDTERSCDRLYEVFDREQLLPREHAEFLTGALEECLTNGVKHGKAEHFTIRLSGDSAHVRLEVADDGKSAFSDANAEERIKNGFGLKKLISYTERCGGKTGFRNEDGFRTIIELPLIVSSGY